MFALCLCYVNVFIDLIFRMKLGMRLRKHQNVNQVRGSRNSDELRFTGYMYYVLLLSCDLCKDPMLVVVADCLMNLVILSVVEHLELKC